MNHNIFVFIFIIAEIIVIAAIILKKIKSKWMILLPYFTTIICVVLLYLIKDVSLLKSVIKNDAFWLFSNISNLAFVMALLSTPLTFISMLIFSKYKN